MIYEIIQIIACGLLFGIVLIIIDRYFTIKRKNDLNTK